MMKVKIRKRKTRDDYRIKPSICFGMKAKILLVTLWITLLVYEVVRHVVTYQYGQENKTVSDNLHSANVSSLLSDALGPKYEDSILKYEKNYEEYEERERLKEENFYEGRKKRVWSTCLKYGLHKSGAVNYWEFFVAKDYLIIWCNIFKAASSSWMYNFNILGGYDEDFLMKTRDAPLTLARQKFPRPTLDELESNLPISTSFLIVREPFERLLSAYRNKLEQYHQTYYQKLSKTIVKAYRNETENLFGKVNSYRPTFYEFVKYITDSNKKNGSKTVFDEHWSPYYKFCTPCQVNFSVIAKVETLSQDSEYILKKSELESVLLEPVLKMRTKPRYTMNKSKDGKDTKSLLKKYFAQIDGKMLKDLLDIYGIDFEMFGYSASKYWKFVRKSKEKTKQKNKAAGKKIQKFREIF